MHSRNLMISAKMGFLSHRDLEAALSIPGEQGVVGIGGHHRVSIGYSFVRKITHPVHSHNLSTSAKMGFFCLTEMSKLVCPRQGSKVSLESWDITGVPLDIHFEKFSRILCTVAI